MACGVLWPVSLAFGQAGEAVRDQRSEWPLCLRVTQIFGLSLPHPRRKAWTGSQIDW